MIRNDNIKEFISFTEGKLKTLTYYSIETSLFETNQYLINKRISLIEYASFFGSLKIFKHLFLNGFQLNQSLWIFTIHGQNPDIIHFLEQNNIEPNDRKFNECLVESIKCHYINMVQYIQNISNDDFSIELNKSIKYIVMSKMIIQNIYCLFIVYIHWPCGEHELDSQSLDDNCIDNDEDKLLNKASSDDLSSYLRS